MAERLVLVPLALVLGVAGLLVAGCGASGGSKGATSTAGTTTTSSGAARTPAAALQSFRTCLSAHGVTLRRPAAPPRAANGKPATRPRGRGRSAIFLLQRLTPAQRKAYQACRSKLPDSGRFRGFGGGRPGGRSNPAFAKYTRCLAQHGVKFGATGQNRTAFRKAQAACRSLLPAPAG